MVNSGNSDRCVCSGSSSKVAVVEVNVVIHAEVLDIVVCVVVSKHSGSMVDVVLVVVVVVLVLVVVVLVVVEVVVVVEEVVVLVVVVVEEVVVIVEVMVIVAVVDVVMVVVGDGNGCSGSSGCSSICERDGSFISSSTKCISDGSKGSCSRSRSGVSSSNDGSSGSCCYSGSSRCNVMVVVLVAMEVVVEVVVFVVVFHGVVVGVCSRS